MKSLIAALTVALALLTTAAIAQDDKPLAVQEIVNRTNRAAYYQGKDGRARVVMTIKDAQGATRSTKQFIILRRDEPNPNDPNDDAYTGDQKFYIYFLLPPDERRTVFMVWKHLDKDDDRWMFLPALNLTKRIASTEKRTSFVGSDFYYEDVSGRNIDADTHELTQTTDKFYVLKNTPKDPASVEFSSYTIWIHRQTFLPIQIEYLDKNGEKYRVYSADKYESIQDFPTITKSTMKDLRTGNQTTIEYSNVEYNKGIPDDIFTERYLRQPPGEYLK